MKYCTKCGAVNQDNARFCADCGAQLPENSTNNNTSGTYQYNYGGYANQPNGYNTNPNQAPSPNPGITERNIAVSVILSIVTCGIYGIYWMIKLNDEINYLAGEPQAPSGGIVFLLTLVTCSIYGFYWMYKMGERCDRIKGISGNTSILYVLLTFLGLSIVNYCLMQDVINKKVCC